jgi:predicted metal-dependent hydrolase
MLYPEEAIDYVVVHELAHLKCRGHDHRFYNLVAKYMPDYKEREKLLKK